jgi:ubiquinone/menaquinone biosynthesis C-methylase UbiE
MNKDNPPSKDYLWLQLRELPYFRGLMRAVEASFYSQVDLPGPILDVGCGDGHFVTTAFDQPIDVGMDPWRAPLGEAALRGGYHLLVQADGENMPFPDNSFGSAFSNSVLEHIPHLESVLAEVRRVLKPGAPFVFCGPNHNFLASLSIGRFLDRLGLRTIGDAYRAFFNRISRHYHSDSPEVWQARLKQAGFAVERWWHYYPPQALHVTEWGHYFGLPSLLSKKLTGRWILSPTPWNLVLTESYTRRYYQEAVRAVFEPCEHGVCTFYITRKVEKG